MVRMAVITLGVLLSFSANAQSIRLKNYLNPENDRFRVFNEIYLAGAMDALTAYNMAAPVKLFCKEGLVSHEEAARTGPTSRRRCQTIRSSSFRCFFF
jgi:hypothetical protein